ncbi:MAG: type II secretion system F family protein [Planctomycetota bacterium]|nr:type II secretion system F family protein [Planctomycetota bacterium]
MSDNRTKELRAADHLNRGGDPMSQSAASLKAQSVFLQNLASMLDVGLPVLTCLKAMVRETRDPELKKAIVVMHDAIASGGTLAGCMDQPVFTGATIMMVAVGEVTGRLDVALRAAGTCLERRAGLAAQG